MGRREMGRKRLRIGRAGKELGKGVGRDGKGREGRQT